MTDVNSELVDILVAYAQCMHDAQDLARRVEYMAASIEENLEDMTDFHDALEALMGAPPLTGSTRRLRIALTDSDRRLLRDMSRARSVLMCDFFMKHPLCSHDASPCSGVLERAWGELDAICTILHGARDLVAHLERELSSSV